MNNKIIIWVLMAFMLVSSAFAYTLVTTDPLDIGAITTETDPIYSAWDKSTGIIINESQISDLTHTIDTNETARVDALYTNVSDWNTAFSWGDHALEGYLTSYTETDPFYFSNPNAYYNSSTFSVDLSDYYFKNETYNKSEVYNKTEINSLLATTTYYPSSINVETGVIDDGNLTSIYYILDGDSLNISEVTGDGIDIYINFTNVTSFDKGTARVWYDGGSAHYIDICIYNYNTTSWDCSWDIEISNDFEILEKTIFNSNDYVNDGVVQTWLNHEGGQGSTQHNLYIDKFVISDGVQAISNNQHDALSGRNDILINHPNIQDIFYNETEINNFLSNFYNKTEIDNFNYVNNSEINISQSQIYDLTNLTDTNETERVNEIVKVTDLFNASGEYINQLVSNSTLVNNNILYYSFDDGDYAGNDIYDLSSNSNNGTNIGGTLGGESGIKNYSISLDGVDDYVSFNALGLSGAYTFNVWYMTEPSSWVASLRGDNDQRIIFVDTDNYVTFGSTASATDLDGYYSGTFPKMFTFMYNGTHKEIYIDGVLINSTSASMGASNGANGLGWRGDGSVFGSSIQDEVGIWNKALNSSELTELYNSGDGLNPYEVLINETLFTLDLNTSLNVDGTIYANDYVTKSKVLDYKELNYTDIYYENIDLWLNNDKSINYDKHPAKQKIKEDKKLVPITETTCEDKFNIINMTTYQECSTKTTGYTEESVFKYGLSMETRVAELERIVYNLILQVNKVKEDVKK